MISTSFAVTMILRSILARRHAEVIISRAGGGIDFIGGALSEQDAHASVAISLTGSPPVSAGHPDIDIGYGIAELPSSRWPTRASK